MIYMKIVFFVSVLALGACGVKGDPLPPESPAEIGRGRPTYKKAAERFDIRTETIEDEDQNDPTKGAAE